MKKSDIAVMPEFFDRYIHLAPDINIISALTRSLKINQQDLEGIKRSQNMRYAAGKWTVKDVLQHITDNERIQAYRALRLARKDTTPLPGYDQDLLAANADVSLRDVDDLINEFNFVRQSTISLFAGFQREALLRVGICNNISISVIALGFVIVGHQEHHYHILREKYFALTNG